jgi:MFS family permease
MSALRDPGFRRLWVAGLISDTGDWLLLVSLPILVYEYTGSTIGTAAVFLLELAPPVLLAPVAARFADGFDRRVTLIAISAAQAALLAPLLLVHGPEQLPLLYAVVVVQSALASVFDPTKNALLPTLLPADRLIGANSLIGLGQNLGRLLGGSLGGLLLAAGGGLSLIATADGASFLLAVGLIAGLAPGVSGRTSTAHSVARDGRGWRALMRTPRVRAGLLVYGISSIAQGIFVVLFIVFVARVLHGDAAEIGLLRGVQAIGAITAGVALALSPRISAGRLTAAAAIAFGVLDLTIWNAPLLSTGEFVFVALFVAVGVPGTGIAIGLTTVLQQATREGQRGAAFAAAGVAASIGEAIGMVVGGLLGDTVGVVTILNVQGVLYLIAGVAAASALARGDPMSASARRSRRRPAGAIRQDPVPDP